MTHLPSPNSLLQQLQQAAPNLALAGERVELQPGPWPGPHDAGDDSLYFPETGLLALSMPPSVYGSQSAARTGLGLMGIHGVWSPNQAQESDFAVEVLVPGHAIRVPHSALRAGDRPLATWWLRVARSNQHLMAQMARMAMCAQNHRPSQSLASWLLLAQHHMDASPIQMPLQAWRDWLGWALAVWQSAWAALESRGAVALLGQGASPCIQIKALDVLSGLACPCHQMASLRDARQGLSG